MINGEPLNPDQFRLNICKPMLKKAKLQKMRIHDCGHTYASLLLQACAPLPYVKEQLGHGTIATIVDLDGNITPGANRNILDSLD